MPFLRPYASLFEDINVAKKVQQILSPEFPKEKATELKKEVDKYSKALEPYVDEIGKKYRGNDKDNIVKLLIGTFTDDSKIKRIAEDFQTFMTYVDAYFHHHLKGFNWDKDILLKLKEIVTPYLDRKAGKQAIDKAGTEETDHIFENDKWVVVSPKTEKAACAWGKGTDWCTAKPTEEGYRNYFNAYNQDGRLVIIQSKTDPKEKYQLHVQSKQFMDRADNQVDPDRVIGRIGHDVDTAIVEWLKKIGEFGSKPMDIGEVIDTYVNSDRNSGMSPKFVKEVFSDSTAITQNWDIPISIADIEYNLGHKEVTKINNLCHRILVKEKMAYDENDDFPALIESFPEALAGVEDALSLAGRFAAESGAEHDMYTDVKKQLTSIMKEKGIAPVDGNWNTHFADNKFVLNPTSLSEIFDEEDQTESINEPYNGWSGFDKEHFKNTFVEEIHSIDPNFTWEEPKESENIQSSEE